LEDLIPIIDGLRNKRKMVGAVLFSVLRIEGEKERDSGKAHKKALVPSARRRYGKGKRVVRKGKGAIRG